TGGIRDNKKPEGQLDPRSLVPRRPREDNERTAGFKLARRSVDVELSIRMIQQGFRVGLIAEGFVYHNRRAPLKQFIKESDGFGKGRIDIYKLFPNELKLVHALPAFFVIGLVCLLLLNPVLPTWSGIGDRLLFLYTFLL